MKKYLLTYDLPFIGQSNKAGKQRKDLLSSIRGMVFKKLETKRFVKLNQSVYLINEEQKANIVPLIKNLKNSITKKLIKKINQINKSRTPRRDLQIKYETIIRLLKQGVLNYSFIVLEVSKVELVIGKSKDFVKEHLSF